MIKLILLSILNLWLHIQCTLRILSTQKVPYLRKSNFVQNLGFWQVLCFQWKLSMLYVCIALMSMFMRAKWFLCQKINTKNSIISYFTKYVSKYIQVYICAFLNQFFSGIYLKVNFDKCIFISIYWGTYLHNKSLSKAYHLVPFPPEKVFPISESVTRSHTVLSFPSSCAPSQSILSVGSEYDSNLM